MAYRPEFREALTLLATAVQRLRERGYEAPILVGGAAVELAGQLDRDYLNHRIGAETGNTASLATLLSWLKK